MGFNGDAGDMTHFVLDPTFVIVAIAYRSGLSKCSKEAVHIDIPAVSHHPPTMSVANFEASTLQTPQVSRNESIPQRGICSFSRESYIGVLEYFLKYVNVTFESDKGRFLYNIWRGFGEGYCCRTTSRIKRYSPEVIGFRPIHTVSSSMVMSGIDVSYHG